MLKALAFVAAIFTPDPFTLLRAWRQRAVYRFRARMAARLAATSHMATVARAVYTGSTEAYTLVKDLPRHPDSSHIQW